jgi:hypothetical protein
MKIIDLELSKHLNNFANNILMMCSRNVAILQNDQLVSIAVFLSGSGCCSVEAKPVTPVEI